MAFTVKINSVQRQPKLDTLDIRWKLGARNLASFTVQDETGAYHPIVGHAVLIEDGATKLFGGSLDEFIERRLGGGEGQPLEHDITCVSYEQRLDKRFINQGIAYGRIIWQAFPSTDFLVMEDGPHNLSNGDAMRVSSDGTLPSPLLADTTYYVVNAESEALQLAATKGGAPIDITDFGSGEHRLIYMAGTIARRVLQHVNIQGDEGVTEDTIGDGAPVELATYDYARATEIWDDLAQRSAYSWWIDVDKGFHFEARTAIAAPFNITADSAIRNVRVRPTREELLNEVYYRASEGAFGPTLVWLDTNAGKHRWKLPTPIKELLWLTLNATQQEVGIKGVDSKEWLYTPGDYYICHDPTQAAPGPNDTLYVYYRAVGSDVVKRWDGVAQAARQAIEGGSGKYCALVEDATVASQGQAEDNADALIADRKDVVREVSYQTKLSGLLPGQLQTITIAAHGLDGSFLIDGVRAFDDRGLVRYDVTALNAHHLGGYLATFKAFLGLKAQVGALAVTPEGVAGAASVPDVLLFDAGMDNGDGSFTHTMRWDTDREGWLLCDWAAMAPLDRTNWAGAAIWIERPDGSQGDVTGLVKAADFVEVAEGDYVARDTMAVAPESIPDPPENWKFFCVSYGLDGEPKRDEAGKVTGKSVTLTTLSSQLAPQVTGFTATQGQGPKTQQGEETFFFQGQYTKPASELWASVEIRALWTGDSQEIILGRWFPAEGETTGYWQTDAWPIGAARGVTIKAYSVNKAGKVNTASPPSQAFTVTPTVGGAGTEYAPVVPTYGAVRTTPIKWQDATNFNSPGGVELYSFTLTWTDPASADYTGVKIYVEYADGNRKPLTGVHTADMSPIETDHWPLAATENFIVWFVSCRGALENSIVDGVTPHVHVTVTKSTPGTVKGDRVNGIITASFAAGIRAPILVASLPSLPDALYPAGTIAYHTGLDALYKVDTAGTGWVKMIHGGKDIQAGTITAIEIFANTITAGEIAAGAIGTQELYAGEILMGGTAANKPARFKVLDSDDSTMLALIGKWEYPAETWWRGGFFTNIWIGPALNDIRIQGSAGGVNITNALFSLTLNTVTTEIQNQEYLAGGPGMRLYHTVGIAGALQTRVCPGYISLSQYVSSGWPDTTRERLRLNISGGSTYLTLLDANGDSAISIMEIGAAEFGIILYGGRHLSVGGNITGGGKIVLSNLPNANPGVGSKELWYDPGAGNTVKYAP